MSDNRIDDLEAEALAELKEAYGLPETSEESPAQEAGTDSLPPETANEQELETSTPDSAESTEAPPENTIPESRYKDAVRAMNSAQQEAAELRKLTAQQAQEIEALRADVEALKAGGNSEQSEDDYDLNEAMEDFPSVVKPLLKQIESLKNELTNVKQQAQTNSSVYQQIEQQRFWDSVRNAHSDLDSIIQDAQDPESNYTQWLKSQSNGVKNLLNSKDPQDIISLLNMFRAANPAATGQQQAAPKRDKLAEARAAASPSVKSGATAAINQKRTFTDADIAKMSQAEFEKNQDAILAALANGEIA